MKKRSMARQPRLFYKVARTKLGPIGIAAIDRGIVRIKLNAPKAEKFAEELKKEFCGFKLLKKSPLIDKAEKEIREYLAGKRKRFSIPVVISATPFRKKVYSALRKIPYGRTKSYGQLAESIGYAGAARAVGSALRANPIPIVIPCHRILGSDGSLTGFAGGLNLKRKLLSIEGAAYRENLPNPGKSASKRRKPRC